MSGLNICVEGIILIGTSILMKEIESASFVRVSYVLLSILCIILAIFEVLLFISEY